MAIKFICTCGKHLRAREEMAARRSMCPRCGRPVGIPSLRPTHPGTDAMPLTPQERRRRNGYALVEESVDPLLATLTAPAEPVVEAVKKPPRPRPSRHLEQHWYQCLLYPLLGWRLLVFLGLVLTLLTGCFVHSLPHLPSVTSLPPRQLLHLSPFVLGVLLVLAYTSGWLECALTSALAGVGPGAYGPGWHLEDALKSGLRWLLCFLAGPIVPAALAVYYWLYGGDLQNLDRLILAELFILTVCTWLLTVVQANRGGRLRDINPLRAVRLLGRLGPRGAIPILVAPALLAGHAVVFVAALMELHREPLAGWLLLACCWMSGLFCTAFLLRLLGVWCHRGPAAGVEPSRGW